MLNAAGVPTPELVASLMVRIEDLEGQVRDLKAVLGQGDPTIATTFKLSARLSDLLGLLLTRPVVSASTICGRMGIATDAKVVVNRLRNALRDYGIEIQSKRNIGYWLDDPTKARAQALVNSRAITPPLSPPVLSEIVVPIPTSSDLAA